MHFGSRGLNTRYGIFNIKSRAIADPAYGAYLRTNNYFTASFKAFPAANFGTLLAAISISSPV
jgi:hypothetical protein